MNLKGNQYLMINLNEISNKLNNEILKNLAFFIPFEIVDNDIFIEIIEKTSYNITQEFIDNYIDAFLFIDESFNIKKVESFELLEISISKKIVELQKNCFTIVQLKDSLGAESFIYFFKIYIQRINSILKGSELMITNYDELYPESSKKPKHIIEMQDAILQSHLKEIEDKIGVKSTQIDNEELIKNIILSKPFNQFTEKKDTEIIPFRDFIRHENKVEIEKTIQLYYSDLKGVSLRYLLEFLLEKNILILNFGDKTKILSSIKSLFKNDDIGVYNSIFGKQVFDKNDLNFKNAKLNFEKTINIS